MIEVFGLAHGTDESERSMRNPDNMKSNSKLSGFTLIELLIVVAIIAILAAIAVPNFLEAQTRSKITRLKADMRTVVTALEAYTVDNNNFIPPWPVGLKPPNSTFAQYPLKVTLADGSPLYPHVGNYLTTPVSHITSIPTDPFATAGMIRYAVQSWNFSIGEVSFWYQADLREPYNIYITNKWYVNIGYLLRSPGPSEIFVGESILYNPTNGTISAGEILYLRTDGFMVE